MPLWFHIFLHVFLGLLPAYIFWRNKWLKAWLIMVAANLIDLDHLWADPIFDPGRCSIGFHFLHSYWAIGAYFLLLLVPKVRIVALGLLLHMLIDYIDCLW